MPSVSAVIPVKDGERYLEELLAALAREHVDEILVVDSGSTDHSVAIALNAGVKLLEIPPEQFGHGRTRNLAAKHTSGDLICFLTQDATPVEGWLASYVSIFEQEERVGAAFGPHLARTDTSPMIARELEEFFAAFSADDQPTLQGEDNEPFLSNVNACYRRSCWETIHFRDVPYSEDQAFGRDMLAAGWLKAYVPQAAVLHAHDYGAVEFMRRYFDEYRGLRDSAGHVEPIRPREWITNTRRQTKADQEWMEKQSFSRRERVRWTSRSLIHHGSRKVFATLGSRSDRLPEWLQSRLSLERREDTTVGALSTTEVQPERTGERYASAIDLLRLGPSKPETKSRNPVTQLLLVVDEQESTKDLSRAVTALEQALPQHGITVQTTTPSETSSDKVADAVLATGWTSALTVNRLSGGFLRGCLLTDYEPTLYATSSQQILANLAYSTTERFIATDAWTCEQLRKQGYVSDLVRRGIDHTAFDTTHELKRKQRVICYAPTAIGEHAASLAVFALEELHQCHPEVELLVFGEGELPRFSFPYTHLGRVPPADLLATHYREASVGIALSLTSTSTELFEMLACGLPVVDLDCGGSSVEVSTCGAARLVAATPTAISAAASELLSDSALRDSLSREATEFVSRYNWTLAAEQLVRTFATWHEELGEVKA